jgi:hypothetical protein
MRIHLPSRVPNRGKKQILKPTKIAKLVSNAVKMSSGGEMIEILALRGMD